MGSLLYAVRRKAVSNPRSLGYEAELPTVFAVDQSSVRALLALAICAKLFIALVLTVQHGTASYRNGYRVHRIEEMRQRPYADECDDALGNHQEQHRL